LVVVLAAMYRRFYLPRLTDDEVRKRFWRVLAVDIGALVAIVVIAVVLAGTAPPVPFVATGVPSPAFVLTGYELPPAPTAIEWILQWRLELVTGLAIASAFVVYLRWVARLRRRGDPWPWARAASWITGLAVLAWVTQGAPAVYGLVSFSGHMIQHMFLVMVVPVPLALGAPVTLALRALPSRTDGSRGPREWLRALVESRPLRLFANPVVAAVNFAGSMFVFYYTGVFGWVLENHVGHVWMVLHFVIVGYLFVNALVGIDPGPRRPPYPFRMVLLFATMAFHAFFGIAIMSSTALLVPRWFGLMGRTWNPDALLDQQVGGELAWGIGEIPVVLLAIGVAMAWRSADERVAERTDRQAERDHDAELGRYNAMLAGLDDADR
jgi:putative copper resistance protein D